MKRYEHQLVDDEQSVSHGAFAIVDNKIGRVIGHLGNRMVADQVVAELNKMEAANVA
jgi:hypothetical protein